MTPFLAGTGPALHDVRSGETWNRPALRAEVADRASAIAGHLRKGRRNVVIAHGNSCSFFADLFAVWAAGGCAIPLSSGLTPGEIARVAEFSEAGAVIAGPGSETPEVGCPVLASGTRAPSPATPLPVTLDAPALILFTSGSTGDPKGVVLSHRALLARCSLNIAAIPAGALDRALCLLPTHFGHGLIGNCLTPLLAGGTVFLMAEPGVQGAAQLGRVIDQHSATFLSSVPAFWKLALRLSDSPSSASLKRVSIGSAPLTADLWREVGRWSAGAPVANMYGLTETANWVAGACDRSFSPENGLVGKTWGGAAAVRDAQGVLSCQGEGEIMLHVPSLMTGYYRRPELTAEAITNGWYATGDIGNLGADGTLRLTGRARYLIIQAGINVFPEELDALFERHPDVAEACAFAEEDPVSGQSATVAIVPVTGRGPDAAGLLAWARTQLRAEAMPRRIVLTDTIPKSDRGKINRDQVARAVGAAR